MVKTDDTYLTLPELDSIRGSKPPHTREELDIMTKVRALWGSPALEAILTSPKPEGRAE